MSGPARPIGPWRPTAFRRFTKSFDTSTETVRMVTDAGSAYVKTLGNRQGPHALACDLVGTGLARWFGLQTFDCAVFPILDDDEIPLARSGLAAPGAAFATRAEEGGPWSGDARDLAVIDNPQDIPRLVVFDTWVRNCDRHPPARLGRGPNYDNVFLSTEGAADGHFRLVAMDHGHCFTCGGELTPRVAGIESIRDADIYGLFPEFRAFMSPPAISECLAELGRFPADVAHELLDGLPAEWQVTVGARNALNSLISDRAAFLAADTAAVCERMLV